MKLHNRTHTSHIGSEFSALDIMVTIWFGFMDLNTVNFSSVERDHFVLSKGHAAPALYDILWRKNLISKQVLDSYGKNGSILAAHPNNDVPGIDIGTGSLGHGLGVGSGIAYSLKKSSLKGRVFVLLSDGECQEGSTIEAANFAGRFKLDNLVAVVDNNGLMAYERTDSVQTIDSVIKKFRSSNWVVRRVDGHNYRQLKHIFEAVPFEKRRPNLIVADTIKGKGIKKMEGKIEWHYKSPSNEDAIEFVKELEEKR